MTGYGRATADLSTGRLTAEVRSVNGKNADLSLRMPRRYAAREFAWRAAYLPRLGRGTATLQLSFEESERAPALNEPLIRAYAAQLVALSDSLGYDPDAWNPLPTVMRLPDVLRTATEPDEAEWQAVEQLLAEAWLAFDAFRDVEGTQTEIALTASLSDIEARAHAASILEPERVAATKARLQAAIAELAATISPERFDQEMVYYLEKLDVAEEQQRLTQHLHYFAQTMATDAEPGRKLGFIAQEMGREINTLGSKANHAGIQRHVVEMKHALEKIKEQVLNVL